ncbi:glycosylated lysosomal membrane protein isoform X2 [Gracilinanus agilis]|uniref:glycosylated lysosomal membrane protein isoform X2 n=1 Tax=Gracilinanus agilis TaxID=191870 RepID=UPI001CFE5CE0|nr:glycosylated lysosomal membrane protein isoform X2 [Gracilinanus agilis]
MHWEPPRAPGVSALCSPLLLFQCLLLLRAPASLLGDQTRRVFLEVLEGPTDPSKSLLHIRAVGANSTIHYIWSNLGPPAVLFVATSTPNSVLNVDWKDLLSPEPERSLVVLPADSVQFSSALIFPRLFEFDSTNSSEVKEQSPGKPYPPYLLADFSWDDITLDLTTLSATFQGHPSKDPLGTFTNGSLAFKVSAFSGSGRQAHLPGLLHTADTTQLELVLDGAAPRGNHSLFGLEVATPVLDSECPQLKEQESIDDEYCPSIFQSPIVRAFFGPSVNFCTFNLTFGNSSNFAYEDHRYLSWSALLGIGIPPVDSFSPMILGIMVVVLGAPGLLLVGGGLSLLLYRHRRYSEYEPIN